MKKISFNIISDNEPQNNSLQDEVSDAARQQFLHDWETELNRVHAKRGHGLNKHVNSLNMETARTPM